MKKAKIHSILIASIVLMASLASCPSNSGTSLHKYYGVWKDIIIKLENNNYNIREVPVSSSLREEAAINRVLRPDYSIRFKVTGGEKEHDVMILWWKGGNFERRRIVVHSPLRCWVKSGLNVISVSTILGEDQNKIILADFEKNSISNIECAFKYTFNNSDGDVSGLDERDLQKTNFLNRILWTMEKARKGWLKPETIYWRISSEDQVDKDLISLVDQITSEVK